MTEYILLESQFISYNEDYAQQHIRASLNRFLSDITEEELKAITGKVLGCFTVPDVAQPDFDLRFRYWGTSGEDQDKLVVGFIGAKPKE